MIASPPASSSGVFGVKAQTGVRMQVEDQISVSEVSHDFTDLSFLQSSGTLIEALHIPPFDSRV